MVAVSYKFLQEVWYLQNLKYKTGAYFSFNFGCYSNQLDIVC